MTKLTLAKHVSGKIVSIHDTANGLACDCKCLCCDERLIARQGQVNDWSFAHESGAECAGAVETSLHKSAIQLIVDEKKLWIGEYDPLNSCRNRVSKNYLEQVYKKYKNNTKPSLSEIEFFSTKELAIKLNVANQQCLKSKLTFSEVHGEKRADGSNRKPDITGKYKGQTIFVEIVVTHKCDEVKISELRALGIPTIQIDISSLLQREFSLETIRDAILNKTTLNGAIVKREWLVKPKYIEEADALALQYFDMAKVKLLEIENKEKEMLAEKKARRQILVVEGIELHIDQRETWGTLWFSQRLPRRSEIFNEIVQKLNAKKVDYYWVVKEKNILETIQNIQTKIDIREKVKLEQEALDKIKHEEEARIKFEENRRQREENARIKALEDEKKLLELKAQEKLELEQAIINKAREKKIIAETERKYAGIVNYQFRLKMIIDELNMLGIKYR